MKGIASSIEEATLVHVNGSASEVEEAGNQPQITQSTQIQKEERSGLLLRAFLHGLLMPYVTKL